MTEMYFQLVINQRRTCDEKNKAVRLGAENTAFGGKGIA